MNFKSAVRLLLIFTIVKADYCDSGYYGPDSTNCIECPANTSSTSGSNLTALSCIACPNNQTSLSGSLCQNCPSNYNSTSGSDCVACPTNYESIAGSDCFSCPSGYSSTSGYTCYATSSKIRYVLVSLATFLIYLL